MNGLKQASDALNAITEKFPNGIVDVSALPEEEKAWLVFKLQVLSDGVTYFKTASKLKKMRNRLVHATEDIPDNELQKMISFVFNNADEISKLTNND